jgi:hypothetical protein
VTFGHGVPSLLQVATILVAGLATNPNYAEAVNAQL